MYNAISYTIKIKIFPYLLLVSIFKQISAIVLCLKLWDRIIDYAFCLIWSGSVVLLNIIDNIIKLCNRKELPAWLRVVADEAIHSWIPLRANAFEKLEKIGQGTYSSVFRARELETGKIVALKKMRFDNFELESVRFMARGIMILRRLDHPNIIKLERLIISRLSCSIYLVFEYMEHDITGLLSSPNIKFSEAHVIMN
ncbi:hypothetical protein VNO77_25704 [Canavalia gladiata]|uniref:Protein kinase domain-containing protein n=1 Tax=Canavalia gladiata TaxID=3824 RepID=A0AAN9LBZ3_CANGL